MTDTDHRFEHDRYLVKPEDTINLADIPTTPCGPALSKKERKQSIASDVKRLAAAQRMLWSSDRDAMLLVLQGLDAAGKDGVIRHVMSGVNPQGCSVHSFKAPNAEERSHHFLWRPQRFLPARGRIAIFNRSYYEEVLIVRVHPELLEKQRLRTPHESHDIWHTRYVDIRMFEDGLARSGTHVLKFFLHLSHDEQRRRFIERIDTPEKQWKFSAADVRERRYWNQYQRVYGEMLSNTSTDANPWFVIPADDKWHARAVIADIVAHTISELDLAPPRLSAGERAALADARQELLGSV